VRGAPRLHERLLAEDLAQETLVEAWRPAHPLRDPAKRPQWLAGIARNVCRRWARGRGRELSRLVPARAREGTEGALANLPDGETGLEVELERGELAALLDRALALLPPETRAILVQRYVEESPYAEIAGRLGLSEDAVSTRLSRGKLQLRRVLAQDLAAEASDYGWQVSGRGLLVEVRHGPSAAAVLLPPAEPLHHAVDGDVRVGRQLHGRGPFLVGLVVVRSDRTSTPWLEQPGSGQILFESVSVNGGWAGR
jgi:RNA polymerase sigma-70 factor (ECF subfamily)